MTEGSHLYPMEHPARTAQLTHEMIVRLLGPHLARDERLAERQA
jgi:hypothetical protein